jgi:hypothetical protein
MSIGLGSILTVGVGLLLYLEVQDQGNATSVGAVDYLLRQFLNKIDTTCLRLPIVGTRMRQAGWEQDWERHQDGCREESGNKNLGLNMVFEKALVGLIVKDLYSINIAALSSKD